MTDKRTLKGIDTIKDSIELKNYDDAITNGKNVIDNLVLSAHYRIFKNKPARKPLYPTKEVEKILNATAIKPELKKIVDRKTIKQTLKWYSKYKDFKTDSTSKQAKNPSKFAKKTFHIISLLNLSSIKVKTYFSK
jgi:hypothetical protein